MPPNASIAAATIAFGSVPVTSTRSGPVGREGVAVAYRRDQPAEPPRNPRRLMAIDPPRPGASEGWGILQSRAGSAYNPRDGATAREAHPKAGSGWSGGGLGRSARRVLPRGRRPLAGGGRRLRRRGLGGPARRRLTGGRSSGQDSVLVDASTGRAGVQEPVVQAMLDAALAALVEGEGAVLRR